MCQDAYKKTSCSDWKENEKWRIAGLKPRPSDKKVVGAIGEMVWIAFTVAGASFLVSGLPWFIAKSQREEVDKDRRSQRNEV